MGEKAELLRRERAPCSCQVEGVNWLQRHFLDEAMRRQEQGDGDSVDGWYQDYADEWTEWVFLRHVDVLSAGASSSRKHKGAFRPLVRKTRATEGYPAI